MLSQKFTRNNTKELGLSLTDLYEDKVNKQLDITKITDGYVSEICIKKESIEWTGIDINPYWKKFGEENGIPISNNSVNTLSQKYQNHHNIMH